MRRYPLYLTGLLVLIVGCSTKATPAVLPTTIDQNAYVPVDNGEGETLPEGEEYNPLDAGAPTEDATVQPDSSVKVDAGVPDTGAKDSGVVPITDAGRKDASSAGDGGFGEVPAEPNECGSGSGYYCGGNGVDGPATWLYYCTKSGTKYVAEVCKVRCVKSAPDVDDFCGVN